MSDVSNLEIKKIKYDDKTFLIKRTISCTDRGMFFFFMEPFQNDFFFSGRKIKNQNNKLG